MTFDFFTFGSSVFEDGAIFFLIKSISLIVLAVVSVKLIYKGMFFRQKQNTVQNMPVKYIAKTLRTLVYIITILIILSGIKPLEGVGKAMLGATSIMAVAISLAAQETFGNYISGFFLAIYQPFRVGDLITLSEKHISGTVTEITFRHTVLKTIENTTMIIPNSVMNSAIIEDKALDSHERYSRYMNVTIAYDSDIVLAKQLIINIVINHPYFMDDRSDSEKAEGAPMMTVQVANFLESAVELKFKVTSEDLKHSFLLCSDVRENILKEFKKNGIGIPYPQVVVHQAEKM